MKQDMAALQRLLEQKERRMQDLMRNTGQVGLPRFSVKRWEGMGREQRGAHV